MEQDLDCWISLKQIIKINGSRFIKEIMKKDKAKEALKEERRVEAIW